MTIVYKDESGRALSLDDLRAFSGKVNWEIKEDQEISSEAKALHQAGRQAGGSGDFETALRYFNEAAEAEPNWAYPLYDMAFTYVMKQDYSHALQCYRTVVKIRPRGFFTAITAVDALEREEAGELPVNTYMGYLQLEWVQDLQQKRDILLGLIERSPNFAPFWLALSQIEESDDKCLSALESGLNASPDAETSGMLRINRALILNQQGEREKAIEELGKLSLDPESTLTTEHSARAALLHILEN